MQVTPVAAAPDTLVAQESESIATMAEFTPDRGIVAWFASNSVAANLLMILVILLGYSRSAHCAEKRFPVLRPIPSTFQSATTVAPPGNREEGVAMKIEEQLGRRIRNQERYQ